MRQSRSPWAALLTAAGEQSHDSVVGLWKAHPGTKVSRAAGPCQFSRWAAMASRADHTGCCKYCHRKHRHSCNTQDSHAWGVAGVNRQSLFIPRPYLSTTLLYIKKCTLKYTAMLQRITLKTCSIKDLLRSRLKFQTSWYSFFLEILKLSKEWKHHRGKKIHKTTHNQNIAVIISILIEILYWILGTGVNMQLYAVGPISLST